MEKKIKLWFTDFYEGFNREDNYLLNLLKEKYQVSLAPKNPDYLIYSCYGKDFLNYTSSIKIYYTGENLVPDFNLCDYAIGFHYLTFNERYLRFPNFALLRDQYEALTATKNFTKEDLKSKTYFCNFIYANARADPARDSFFHALNHYKMVSSPGPHLNNCVMEVGERFSEDWMYTKLNFQSKCKFSLAFENSSSPGYTTEKIMHAFNANTVPVYWGNPDISKDFNSEAFINCHDFSNFSEVIREIQKIDLNNDLYLKVLNTPPFKNNKLPECFSEKVLLDFFEHIFNLEKKAAFQRPVYGTTQKYERELLNLVKKNKSTSFKNLKAKIKRKFQ